MTVTPTLMVGERCRRNILVGFDSTAFSTGGGGGSARFVGDDGSFSITLQQYVRH